MTPAAVASLIAYGHRVIVETSAGVKANYSDHDFSEAGADIGYSKDQVYKANILIKVAPPTLREMDFLRPGQILFSPLQLPIISPEFILKLKAKRVTALAMEYIKDENGTFPVVRIMSEMAGMSSILTAAELLTNSKEGKGVLFGGISGVSAGIMLRRHFSALDLFGLRPARHHHCRRPILIVLFRRKNMAVKVLILINIYIVY